MLPKFEIKQWKDNPNEVFMQCFCGAQGTVLHCNNGICEPKVYHYPTCQHFDDLRAEIVPNPDPVEGVCIRGKVQFRAAPIIPGAKLKKRLQVLTGKRRRWDCTYWTLYGKNQIAVQGLYRGHYADAIMTQDAFIAALESVNCIEALEIIDTVKRISK